MTAHVTAFITSKLIDFLPSASEMLPAAKCYMVCDAVKEPQVTAMIITLNWLNCKTKTYTSAWSGLKEVVGEIAKWHELLQVCGHFMVSSCFAKPVRIRYFKARRSGKNTALLEALRFLSHGKGPDDHQNVAKLVYDILKTDILTKKPCGCLVPY